MHRPVLAAAALLALLASACTTAPATYRLVVRNSVPTLVPPGVKSERVTRASVRLPGGKCPPERLERDILAKAAPGWLTARVADLESRGCLAAGTGRPLAERLSASLPLPLGAAYRLLHPNLAADGYIDLLPSYRLRVVSPLYPAGALPADPGAVTTVVSPNGEPMLQARAAPGLLGYEIAWYNVGPHSLDVLNTEAFRNGVRTTSRSSAFAYFGFDRSRSLYRMLFLTRSSPSDRDALVLAARSESELEAATRELAANSQLCRTPAYQSRCVILPRQVALTAFVAVTVNGVETLVAPGATLREAIRTAGRDPATVDLNRLRVLKLHAGRAVPLEHQSEAILNLPLNGGEVVHW